MDVLPWVIHVRWNAKDKVLGPIGGSCMLGCGDGLWCWCRYECRGGGGNFSISGDRSGNRNTLGTIWLRRSIMIDFLIRRDGGWWQCRYRCRMRTSKIQNQKTDDGTYWH